MNEEAVKATDYLAEWLVTHRSEIGGQQLKFATQEEYSKTLRVEFETSKYLIHLCAWDHACCLDILAFNKTDEGDDYTVVGECDGAIGLYARLDTFLHWLKVNEPNHHD